MTTLTHQLPDIQCNNRELRHLTKDCLAALTLANHMSEPFIFIRGDQLVTVARPGDGSERTKIQPITPNLLRSMLTTCANFYRLQEFKHHSIHTPTSPPFEAVSDILADSTKWRFHRLDVLTEVPVVRPNGSILIEPGYDEDLKYYYSPTALTFPPIPSRPTYDDAKRAHAVIWDVLFDFPFVDDASRAHALALFLTPFIRPLIGATNVPIITVDAVTPGTGKGLLVDVISEILTGSTAAIRTAPTRDEAEWKKVLLAVFSEGAPLTILDNLDTVLRSASLAAAVTASEYTDRILGLSKNATVPNRTVFCVTGNNISLGGDIPRRCISIKLDAKVSRPWLRHGFRHTDLKAYVLFKRGDLLAALLTLISAWIKAGSPRPKPEIEPLGSFERWSHTIGGILSFINVKGFLDNLEQMYSESDPSDQQWEAFLSVIKEQIPGTFTVKSLVKRMNETLGSNHRLRNSLPEDIGDSPTAKQLGCAFRAKCLRRYGQSSIRLERGGITDGSQVWIIRTGTK